jgi:hypothetical protein
MTNPIPHRVALVVACLGALAVAGPGRAQTAFQSGLLRKTPKAGLPDVPAPPQAWPRLDPGSVVCNSEDDLERLAARHSGETVSGPIDCQVIQNPTAIKILQRIGPGKQQVQFTSGKVGTVGWTDAWLPEKAPPNPNRATAAR